MNLFYAIVVSTLSDAKIEEDAKQKKKWAVLSDRLNETWKAMNRGGCWAAGVSAPFVVTLQTLGSAM